MPQSNTTEARNTKALEQRLHLGYVYDFNRINAMDSIFTIGYIILIELFHNIGIDIRINLRRSLLVQIVSTDFTGRPIVIVTPGSSITLIVQFHFVALKFLYGFD